VNRGLIASSGLHVGLFLLFLAGPAPKPFRWEPKTAIPVDLVAPTPKLPERPPARPEPPEEVPPPVKEPVVEKVVEKVEEAPAETPKPPEPTPVKKPKPKPQPVLKKIAPRREQDDGPSLAERLKQQMENVASTADTPTPPDDAPVSEQTPAPASSSADVEAADFPFAWYLRTVQTKVLSAWDTPGERLLHGNVVLVTFTIHRDGRATGVHVSGPSGTPGLDVSATRAVERSQPFPPLPDAWEEEVLELTIRFTARGGSG
jgi:protein TonB